MVIRKNDVCPINFNGLNISDYTANAKLISSFAIIDVPPEFSHQLSWSKRSEKYYYIISGKIEFVVDNKPFILEKGDLCHIKQGEKFMYKNTFFENAVMVLVHTPNFDLNEEVFE
jgi:mannose-6-phosphate isomerase-like protein (cupin superfamily)